MDVLIVVCTRQRNSELRELLPLLSEQTRSVAHTAEILVVENGEESEASSLAHEHAANYLVEPKVGVGHARNRALAYARERLPDAVIFFDDDQLPSPAWLSSMLTAHSSDPHAIWIGPVRPCLDFELPTWAAGGWPWQRPHYPDGAIVKVAGDGNCLLPRAVLQHPQCRYSEDFAAGMGQDTELFVRLRKGHVSRIRWAGEACASERVPAQRRRPDWVVDRSRRSARAWGLVQIRSGRVVGPARVAISAAKSVASGSALRLLWIMTGNPKYAVMSACLRARRSGYLELFAVSRRGRR